MLRLGPVVAVLALPLVAQADGAFAFRLARGGDVPASVSVAELTLVNQSGDELVYETWDGGTLHNDLERLEAGTWTSVGLGYCGLGLDGETSIAAGARGTLRAYLTAEPGTYRIVMHARRRDANGAMTDVEIRSDSFVRR